MTFRELHWFAFIAIAWVAMLGPGTIEGKYFPAADPMELSNFKRGTYVQNISGVEKSMLLVWGKSARLRPECYFRDIEWFLGSRDGKNVPVQTVLGPPKLRANGVFSFGPWYVVLESLGDLIENSFSDALHRCFYFGIPSPWLTRSPFWK